VGVVKALSERKKVTIKGISGTSIGALNGAIISTAPSLKDAYTRLYDIWGTFSEATPLKPNIVHYITSFVEFLAKG
jgi:NTE family protein